MTDETVPDVTDNTGFMLVFGWYAIVGCIIFAISIGIADIVVPDHDWMADTISDLGAGKYEYIVDIGIYAFSASLISVALLAAHVHMGDWGWTLGIVCVAMMALVVFLIGARNEYGDSDQDGAVIHVYLVYGLGALMTAAPLLMARGAGRCGSHYKIILIAIAALWCVSAPVFFFLPTDIDGIYERGLGLIAFAFVGTLATLYIRRGRKLRVAQ